MLNDTRPRWCCTNEIKLDISYGITASVGNFTHLLLNVNSTVSNLEYMHKFRVCVCIIRNVKPARKSYPKPIFCYSITEPQQKICGNGVVDPGEECDCGWEEDCKDSCCFPMSRHPSKDKPPCTLTPQAKCSPSQEPWWNLSNIQISVIQNRVFLFLIDVLITFSQ